MATRATLFVIPGSHPAMTARLELGLKGIEYRRIDLIPVLSKGVLRAAGFPGNTVPALRIGGEKLQGSRDISRALDRLVPEPPLFPADPQARAKVEDAELWGDETLQAPARRILWNGLKRDRSALESFSKGAKLGVPVKLAVKTGAPIVALSARFNEATDENVRADLQALPGYLDTIDAWIGEGVLGGAQPNAADLQIATSIRLLMSMDDVRPAIAQRPAGKLAERVVPDYPGHLPPVLPKEWLEPLGGLEGSGRVHTLPRTEALEGGVQPGPVWKLELRIELQERREDESAAGHLRVRERKTVSDKLDVAEEQEVHVDRPWAVARAGEHAAELDLDCLAKVEERLGVEIGPDADGGVQEVRLVEVLPDRLGHIRRGCGLYLHPVLAEQLDRASQVCPRVADVGAEAEVAAAAHPSPSVSSPVSIRSWVTSTATSSMERGRGGSGFAARTRADSQPKRSMRRSPMTLQSRSSVL